MDSLNIKKNDLFKLKDGGMREVNEPRLKARGINSG